MYMIIPVYAYKGEGECIDIGTIANCVEVYEEHENKQVVFQSNNYFELLRGVVSHSMSLI